MKKTLLALALIVALPVQSEEIDCDLYTEAARATMQARQAGVPMETMMKHANTGKTNQNLLRSFVLNAYDKPLYHTEASKQTSINEFAAEFMGSCYRFNRDKTND